MSTEVQIWPLNEMLTALVRERDNAETPEEKAHADEALKLFVSAEVIAKPDIFIAHLRHYQTHAEIADREANRMAGIGRRWARRAENLQAFVLEALQQSGKKELEGDLGTFSSAKNPASVEITDSSLIPEELVQYSGTISGQAWYEMSQIEHDGPYTDMWWKGRQDVQMERVPLKEKIKAALKQDCENCEGRGCMAGLKEVECAECGGSGKRYITGARLVNDKVRLTVK